MYNSIQTFIFEYCLYFKVKMSKITVNIIDDRHEYLSYRSKCMKCKYFDASGLSCKAFPDGIPVKYLSGEADHTEVDYDQKGTIIFTSKI